MTQKWVKSTNSDHAHLLDFELCHQNKIKMFLGIFIEIVILLVQASHPTKLIRN